MREGEAMSDINEKAARRILWPIALGAAFGLSAGNFIWQAMTAHPSWLTATERSFFQCVAILAVAITFAIRTHAIAKAEAR